MNEDSYDRIQIWTDGSYRPDHNTGGAGWVIHYPDDTRDRQCLALPALRDSFTYGSHIAELSAATHALNALPEGSLINLHMDCIFALKSLQLGILATRKYLEGSSLQQAFRKAVTATLRHADVSYALASDKRDTQMGHAHRLSRIASEPPPLKSKPQ